LQHEKLLFEKDGRIRYASIILSVELD